jgi:hypothetical protein
MVTPSQPELELPREGDVGLKHMLQRTVGPASSIHAFAKKLQRADE